MVFYSRNLTKIGGLKRKSLIKPGSLERKKVTKGDIKRKVTTTSSTGMSIIENIGSTTISIRKVSTKNTVLNKAGIKVKKVSFVKRKLVFQKSKK